MPISATFVNEVDTSPKDWTAEFAKLEGDELRNAVLARIDALEARRVAPHLASHGYVYRDSPLVVPGAEVAPPAAYFSDVPWVEVGDWIPHRELPDGRALLDLPRVGFALLTADRDSATGLTRVAKEIGIPLASAEISPGMLESLLGIVPKAGR